MKDLKDFAATKEFLIAAHRGASGTMPENTLTAFQEAVNLGVDMIELDVQFTSDGQIIVYHDDIFHEANKNISDLTYQEINAYNKNISDINKIPLLSEVFDIIKDKVYLGIEIKTAFSDAFKMKSNLLNIIDLLSQNKYNKQTIIISFDINNLIFIKSHNRYSYTAAIYLKEIANLPSEYQAKTGCDAFICSIDELNYEIMSDAKKHDIWLGVYGANDSTAIGKAKKYGVKVIGTDFPAILTK